MGRRYATTLDHCWDMISNIVQFECNLIKGERLICNSTSQCIELLVRVIRSSLSFSCQHSGLENSVAISSYAQLNLAHKSSIENPMTCICDLVQGLCGYNADGDLLCCGNPSKPMRATTPRCDLGHAITRIIVQSIIRSCLHPCNILGRLLIPLWPCLSPPSDLVGTAE